MGKMMDLTLSHPDGLTVHFCLQFPWLSNKRKSRLYLPHGQLLECSLSG